MTILMDVLFFVSIVVYFLAMICQFAGILFKKPILNKASWGTSIAGFIILTAYIALRGIEAGYLPLSNQFEFATALGWGVGLLHIIMKWKMKQNWVASVALPAVFLVISYAALLPRDIRELMPALRSAWFGLHIGAAVFSYASFTIAGGIGIKYLMAHKKDPDDTHLPQLDYFAYRLIAFGFLMLTITILSGCIWAEQAWSAFWTWDPKETWALITWIIYAVYLHQRLRKKWQGKRMAYFTIIALVCVLFTFIGVNQLLPGLHSYA